MSFLVTWSSIQLPRSGMTRQAWSLRSPASISTTKSTPGAAVELADDDPLGAVDDELAAADHDRHVAEVDRLLDRRLPLVQAEPDVERPAVGQAELAALVGLVARLAQVELDVFQLERLVIALDREDLAEDPLQPASLAVLGRRCRPGGTARSSGSGSRSGRGPGTRRRSGRNSVAWPGMIRRTVRRGGHSVALLKGRWWARAVGCQASGRGRVGEPDPPASVRRGGIRPTSRAGRPPASPSGRCRGPRHRPMARRRGSAAGRRRIEESLIGGSGVASRACRCLDARIVDSGLGLSHRNAGRAIT